MTDHQADRDARRERAVDEDQATPLKPADESLHASDRADVLNPEEPVGPRPQRPSPADPERDERSAEDHPT